MEGRRKALEALKRATLNKRDQLTEAEDLDDDDNDNQTLVNEGSKLFMADDDERVTTDVKHRDELKQKLEQLQNRKLIVDELLSNLTSLKPTSESSSIVHCASDSANHTAKQAEKLLTILENEEKLEFVLSIELNWFNRFPTSIDKLYFRKLYTMQSRLEKLKNVVEHYNEEKTLNSLIDTYAEDDDDLANENRIVVNNKNNVTASSMSSSVTSTSQRANPMSLDLDFLQIKQKYIDGYVNTTSTVMIKYPSDLSYASRHSKTNK